MRVYMEKVVFLDVTNKIPVVEMPDDVILSQPPPGEDKKIVSTTYNPTTKTIKVVYKGS